MKMASRLNEKKVNSSTSKLLKQLIFLATMSYTNFRECMNAQFRNKLVPEHLILVIFNRFRQFKVKENSNGTEMSEEMDILDFLLCINLLSSIPVDLKIQSKPALYLSRFRHV